MPSRSVVVIGAGIAGLTAAYRLSNAGFHVTVLEASDRVGGRMSTDRRDGYVIDRGAQFLSDGYDVIGALISELGLAPSVTHPTAWTGTVRGGAVRRINLRFPWTLATSGLLSWRGALRVARATLALRRATRRLPLNDYSQWHMLDDADAAEWVAASFGREALEVLFEPMLEGFYFQPPEGMSRAWPAIVWSFGARRKRVAALAGGVGGLPEALARQVRVRLATRAEAIDAVGARVRVTTSAGSFEADHVVLATTASAAKRMYTPVHDVEKRLLETSYSSSINISFAVAEGVSTAIVAKDIYGLLIPRRERRVIAAIGIESRKCRRNVPGGELLNVMLDGTTGRRLFAASDEEVLAEVLPELQQYFPGVDGKIELVHFNRWAEAEPRSPIGRSRDLHEYRRLCRPDTRVILAGDYMSIPCAEGAAESGAWAAAVLSGGAGTAPGQPAGRRRAGYGSARMPPWGAAPP